MLPEAKTTLGEYAGTGAEFVGAGGMFNALTKKGTQALAKKIVKDMPIDFAAGVGAEVATDIVESQDVLPESMQPAAEAVAPFAGALAGAMTPGALAGVAKKAGKVAANQGRALEARAFGLNKTRLKEANARHFELIMDEGQIVNPMNVAVQSFRKRAGKRIKDHDPNGS